MSERKVFRGGDFLVGDIDEDDIFIPEDFTNEQQMVGKAALDFANKKLADRIRGRAGCRGT
jgi:hypothetical protein